MGSMSLFGCIPGILQLRFQPTIFAVIVCNFLKNKTPFHPVRRYSCVQCNQDGTSRNLGAVALAWREHGVHQHGDVVKGSIVRSVYRDI